MCSFIIPETMEQNSTFRAKALVGRLIVSLSALAVVATLPSCDSNFIAIVCTITYIFRVLYCHEFISSLSGTLKLRTLASKIQPQCWFGLSKFTVTDASKKWIQNLKESLMLCSRACQQGLIAINYLTASWRAYLSPELKIRKII